ncbi:hypothetical protein [Planctobacterium marinum]|uniref:hypothetical protein n=1 Tax=Planctobacterium marinum TaxID=1631968 RepID=UPI001E641310|nr:hypothetical protein [Planctobacterium marinum]MCC2606577.1 hypothetical protein [Planctobacterium marinum]
MVRPAKTKRIRRVKHTNQKHPSVKAKSNLGPVSTDNVELIGTAGTRNKGGGSGGEAWLVMVDGKRAGKAYINMLDDPIRGLHPSFHVFLNRPSQGRHIGRIVYKSCCSRSKYDVIYAHMRKSNIASRKAAEYAGFVDVTSQEDMQLVMVWRKPN